VARQNTRLRIAPAKLHPSAEPLIVYAAMLAPEPIPLFLFSEAREKLGEPLATALAGDGLDEAVAALRTFALIERESIDDERDLSFTNDAIRLHRLVREIALDRREGEVREGMRQQPRRPAQGPGRPSGGAAAVRARAGDLREGARPRASQHRDKPQQPRHPAPGPGRSLGGAAAL
jgi:hypothetical protein